VTAQTITIAQCIDCGGRFPLPAEFLDCGLRCPHCKAVTKAARAEGAVAAADASARPAHEAWASEQPRHLHVSPPTRPRRPSLIATVLGSPGVIFAVVGVVLVILATLLMKMSMTGGDLPAP